MHSSRRTTFWKIQLQNACFECGRCAMLNRKKLRTAQVASGLPWTPITLHQSSRSRQENSNIFTILSGNVCGTEWTTFNKTLLVSFGEAHHSHHLRSSTARLLWCATNIQPQVYRRNGSLIDGLYALSTSTFLRRLSSFIQCNEGS